MGAVCWCLAWGMLFGALPLFSRVQPTPRNGGVRGSWSSDCNGHDWPAPSILDDQDRCLQAAHQNPRSAEERGGLHLCSHTEVQVGVPAKHVHLLSERKFSCPPGALRGMTGDSATQRPSPPASGEQFSWLKMTRKGPLHSDGKTPVSLDWSTSAHSSHSRLPGPCTTSVSEAQPGPERSCLLTRRPPGPIPVQDPSHAVNPVLHSFPEAGVQAPLPLGFHVHLASPAAVCLTLDFGDSSGVEIRLNNASEAAVATAYHQYGTEGVYMLKAVIYNEFHGAEVELGPYYMEVSQKNVSVFLNSSSVHKDEALVFTGSSVNPENTVVVHRFSPSSSYNVSFISQTQVGDSQAWLGVTIRYKMQPVSVYTNGTVFAADTDIMFTAVTKETTPLEFAWYFGDGPPVRTTLRIIKKRLSIPQRYHVTVRAASRLSSVVSEPHLITVQKKIIANRLMSAPSALVNTSVTFECRINFGTDVAYLWDFGDGTVSPGHSSSSHVYSREGEFTVEVLAFNNVSTAILKKHLFITREPCLPPLVKNMGSGKVQIWRSQPMRLGVTFEAAILCDISQGLSYTWSFMDSEGSPVPLPAAVNTHRQTIVLPGYLLEYGNYTALAKVQIKGSVVYSNFCVGVEVWARAPVSVISEGTHLFVPRTAASSIILRGSQSFDPDRPGTTLRYYWTCMAASMPGQPCFHDSAQFLDSGAPTISFPVSWLSHSYDQFLVTLTVSSGDRNSSEAQVFLSTRPEPAFRFVHITWVSFKNIFINWNEELSLGAVCEDCAELPHLSYSWDLFLVNATERSRTEAPLCSAVGLLGSSGLGALLQSPESDTTRTTTPSSRQLSSKTLHWSALPATRRASMGPVPGIHRIPAAGDSAVPGEAPEEGPLGPGPESQGLPPSTTSPPGGRGPSHDPASPLFDFEAYYSDIQEAIPSRGRQPGSNTSLPESGPGANAEGHPGEGDGDNLVDPAFSEGRAVPVLMVDWHKTLVSQAVFQGYTSLGITGQTVTIKPYSLSPGETYVLQASVGSRQSLVGRAQLYLTVNRTPSNVACQVQPHRGLEAHTIFSVFCMSGRPDFLYKFSYQIGNVSKHTLYYGRDAQLYFALPAGEPSDGYKVLVSTEITDREGSKARPCAVAVTVLPRYRGDDCPAGEELYNSSLKNLATLQLMGSYVEVRNYITMIASILSRLTKEDRSDSCSQWSQIQDALISSVCRLAFADQDEMTDSVLMLKGLINSPNKLSFDSAVLILKYSRTLLAPGQLSGRCVVDKGLRLELILLIARVWEASEQEKSREEDYLREEGIEIISNLLLSCLSSHPERRLYVRTGRMEFWTLLHQNFQSSVQNLSSIQVHLPGDLTGHSPEEVKTQSPCYISRLILFKKNPYPGRQAAGQIDGVVRLTIFSCSSRRPINRQRLKTHVTVESGEEDDRDNSKNKTTFSLLREKVNFHQFIGLSENSQESLQIRIKFSKPNVKAFPIMLLVRFFKKPTPSDFLVKQIYSWDEQTVYISVPAVSWKDADVGYLSLLDADYDRTPPNKHLAETVNYTVHFQWTRCLFWEQREWKSGSFPPQPGSSPGRVSCSYDRLTAFSVLRRGLNASVEVSDIATLRRHPQNLFPSVFVMVSVIVYGLLVIKCRHADRHEEKKTGYIFLHGDALPDCQLYAVVVDTGFRTPARLTSKVYLVLYGENGLSETKELYCSDKPLFERNSRHTFILSTPEQLGPLRKIRLWHDSRGPSPEWFVSHVMVKELHTGQPWFFPAQCWLAASRGDGCVMREITCLHQGLGFRKLFYFKFTEYLEDFHIWLSVYSRPSSSRYLHTHRLTVAFSLLCVYSCLAASAAARGQEQLPMGVTPTAVTAASFRLALLCSLLASPGAQLLSLLFQLSKEDSRPARAQLHSPLREAQAEATLGPDSSGRLSGPQEPCQHPPSAVPSASARARRKAADSSGMACPHQELEAQEADHCQSSLREKSGPHSPCSQAPSSGLEGLVAQQLKARLPWSDFAAWAVCGTVSLACGLGTGFLGYRFGPAQCEQWLCLLSLSLVCCVFVTQPLMICIVALGFAWKRRDDHHFFTESLGEATRNLDSELEGLARMPFALSPHRCLPECAGQARQVLAARLRARHLRLVHPPSTDELKDTRARLRRENSTQAALRDISLHILTLLLFSFIIYGTYPREEYSLNQAIRKEFTRNGRNPLGAVRSVEEWWDWSLTTLLDGLYPGGTLAAQEPRAQAGALGGKCYQIGSLVIEQLKVSPSSECKPPRMSSGLTGDALPACSSKVGDFEHSYEIFPENQNVTLCGPEGCGVRANCVQSLGRTRREAHAALSSLRTRRWINHSTRAVSVHFTLYNPPTRLFTRLTLSVELLPTGSLVPSSLVESFSIFHSNTPLRYYLILSQLAFLVLNLAHLWFQLYNLIEKGGLNYWRKPRNWLELSVAGVGLTYHAACGHLATLAGGIADQFRQGLCQASLDLSLVATWNQRVQWLQGILTFLLALKCIYPLGLQKTMVSCSSTRHRLPTSIIAPGLAGALVLAALAHLRRLLLPTWQRPASPFSDAFARLPWRVPGRRQQDLLPSLPMSAQRAAAWYYGVLLIVMATLCFQMLRGSLMTFSRKRKPFQSKHLLRLRDVAVYAWGKALTYLGLEKPMLKEPETAENQNYYLDEFVNLLDELLMKINGLSDSLQLPLLEEPIRSTMKEKEEGSSQATVQTRRRPQEEIRITTRAISGHPVSPTLPTVYPVPQLSFTDKSPTE